MPTTAFVKGFASRDPVQTYLTDICTVTANITGLPALNVPCGFDGDGLPIGAQLLGPAGGELAVLDAAHAFQQETDWHKRRPPARKTAERSPSPAEPERKGGSL